MNEAMLRVAPNKQRAFMENYIRFTHVDNTRLRGRIYGGKYVLRHHELCQLTEHTYGIRVSIDAIG